jgi:hypothetical protein
MPWAGLVLGTLGGGLAHQLGASWTFANCRAGSPWAIVLGAILGIALTALGALASWRAFVAGHEASPRRMIAAISLMAAALFTVAILLPVIAALVIPGCWG